MECESEHYLWLWGRGLEEETERREPIMRWWEAGLSDPGPVSSQVEAECVRGWGWGCACVFVRLLCMFRNPRDSTDSTEGQRGEGLSCQESWYLFTRSNTRKRNYAQTTNTVAEPGNDDHSLQMLKFLQKVWNFYTKNKNVILQYFRYIILRIKE